MPHALLITAAEPYVDRWHALRETGERLAERLESAGYTVRIETDLARAVDAIPGADLLAVNLAGNFAAPDPLAAQIDRALRDHARQSRPVLALHASSIAFGESPAWAEILGGHWERGRSGHPQIGWHLLQVDRRAHPLLDDLADFELYDERYSNLAVSASVTPLVRHTEDGVVHPLVWLHEAPEGSRVVYDALGHGVESFESVEHRVILDRAIAWLGGADVRPGVDIPGSDA